MKLILLGTLALTASLVFVVHENQKFKRYAVEWHKAQANGDKCNMSRYWEAEYLEFGAIFLPPPWLILKNWHHDYLDDVLTVCPEDSHETH